MDRIKDLVQSFIKKTGLDDGEEELFIQDNWPKMVGKEFEKTTKPFKYSNNKLFIYVDNSVIMGESVYKKKQIVRRINDIFRQEKVTELIFRLKK